MHDTTPAYGLWSLVIINSLVFIMFGFLLQWPTLVTLVMFPILVFMYAQLARREEQEVHAQFGDEYRRYMGRTPAFFPRFGAESRQS